MNKLKEILDKQGRSINWLAQRSGLSRQTIWNVIKGNNIPINKTKEKISNALDLPLNVIFFDKKLTFTEILINNPSSSPQNKLGEE